MIPLCDLQQQYSSLQEEIDVAMQQVATDARYILGPNVKAFEQEIAEYIGAKYAIGVGSGTDALHLSLRALEIGPGDEVITTPFTFIGTTEAICLVGATPVFIDIDLQTFNICTDQIEEAITPRTKAILPVHLYGQPCNLDPIVEIAENHGLDIVEDCAQAIGAAYKDQKVGTFGKAGCFSFFPSKNLGCFGDGGMVVTDDAEVYARVEMLRRHGGKVKYHHTELGLNSRLDELQAAILRVKLPHLDRWNLARNAIAIRYTESLTHPFIEQTPPLSKDNYATVFHQFTILAGERDDLGGLLSESDIGNAVYYPIPLHLQEVYEDLGNKMGDFPNAEYASNHCLSLPMFPHLRADELDHIIKAVNRFSSTACTA